MLLPDQVSGTWTALRSFRSNRIGAPACSEPIYPGAQETIYGSEVVSFCLMYFHCTCIEFLRRLVKPADTQITLQAAQIFSDTKGKEAKSVSRVSSFQ